MRDITETVKVVRLLNLKLARLGLDRSYQPIEATRQLGLSVHQVNQQTITTIGSLGRSHYRNYRDNLTPGVVRLSKWRVQTKYRIYKPRATYET